VHQQVFFTYWYCTTHYTALSQLTALLSLQKNIVHRDLKLGNLVLNRRTHRVTITNFCLGKHLGSENDLLKDQRGSPAYISPDVLCGKPYLGEYYRLFRLSVMLGQSARVHECMYCKCSGWSHAGCPKLYQGEEGLYPAAPLCQE
jgi:serine/threonine protein kinase